MKLTSYLFVLTTCMSAMPQLASAQDTEIKFVVPVNLTNLMPMVEDVRVACGIQSSAVVQNPPDQARPWLYVGKVGAPVRVVNGRVNAVIEVVVVVPRLVDPAGKTASYSCKLMGTWRAPNNVLQFAEFQSNNDTPAFRLQVQPIEGTFPLVDQTAAP